MLKLQIISINQLLIINLEYDSKILNLESHLINLNLENLTILIFKMNCNKVFSIENFLSNIVPLFTQEMISLLKFNDFVIEVDSKNSIIKSLYQDKYKKYSNLRLYLSNLDKNSFQNVIYTFSDPITDLFKDKNYIINNNFSLEKTLIINLLENLDIEKFKENIKSKDYSLFIIKFQKNENYKIIQLIKVKMIILKIITKTKYFYLLFIIKNIENIK